METHVYSSIDRTERIKKTFSTTDIFETISNYETLHVVFFKVIARIRTTLKLINDYKTNRKAYFLTSTDCDVLDDLESFLKELDDIYGGVYNALCTLKLVLLLNSSGRKEGSERDELIDNVQCVEGAEAFLKSINRLVYPSRGVDDKDAPTRIDAREILAAFVSTQDSHARDDIKYDGTDAEYEFGVLKRMTMALNVVPMHRIFLPLGELITSTSTEDAEDIAKGIGNGLLLRLSRCCIEGVDPLGGRYDVRWRRRDKTLRNVTDAIDSDAFVRNLALSNVNDVDIQPECLYVKCCSLECDFGVVTNYGYWCEYGVVDGDGCCPWVKPALKRCVAVLNAIMWTCATCTLYDEKNVAYTMGHDEFAEEEAEITSSITID